MTESLTDEEMIVRIHIACGPTIADWVRGVVAARERAGQEVLRLTEVIEEHAKVLSGPICESYAVEAGRIFDPSAISREVSVWLSPSVHRIRVPSPVAAWSADHRAAFIRESEIGIGQKVAKTLASEIWPMIPLEEKAKP